MLKIKYFEIHNGSDAHNVLLLCVFSPTIKQKIKPLSLTPAQLAEQSYAP